MENVYKKELLARYDRPVKDENGKPKLVWHKTEDKKPFAAEMNQQRFFKKIC